ncbi:hypothetical protein JKG68_15155 [Microvirga aerilata]|uniref:Uncharacterized protein n=1 Tax=Microvirga aerilata TaxID=670292 RepID=A0A936Z9E6_9HYPH|nr:hypothetical protein [Microvirga aerilata]MBL0405307.1 hypothetical protein [Microvirga aerilata]
MAQEISGAAHRLPEEPLTAFLAMRGRAYDGALMWVGRAVNGWVKPGCTPAELRDAAWAEALVQAVLAKAVGESEGPCPLRWVADQWGSRTASYNTARSAFWRTARRILLEAGDAGATEGPGPRGSCGPTSTSSRRKRAGTRARRSPPCSGRDAGSCCCTRSQPSVPGASSWLRA